MNAMRAGANQTYVATAPLMPTAARVTPAPVFATRHQYRRIWNQQKKRRRLPPQVTAACQTATGTVRRKPSRL